MVKVNNPIIITPPEFLNVLNSWIKEGITEGKFSVTDKGDTSLDHVKIELLTTSEPSTEGKIGYIEINKDLIQFNEFLSMAILSAEILKRARTEKVAVAIDLSKKDLYSAYETLFIGLFYSCPDDKAGVINYKEFTFRAIESLVILIPSYFGTV